MAVPRSKFTDRASPFLPAVQASAAAGAKITIDRCVANIFAGGSQEAKQLSEHLQQNNAQLNFLGEEEVLELRALWKKVLSRCQFSLADSRDVTSIVVHKSDKIRLTQFGNYLHQIAYRELIGVDGLINDDALTVFGLHENGPARAVILEAEEHAAEFKRIKEHHGCFGDVERQFKLLVSKHCVTGFVSAIIAAELRPAITEIMNERRRKKIGDLDPRIVGLEVALCSIKKITEKESFSVLIDEIKHQLEILDNDRPLFGGNYKDVLDKYIKNITATLEELNAILEAKPPEFTLQQVIDNLLRYTNSTMQNQNIKKKINDSKDRMNAFKQIITNIEYMERRITIAGAELDGRLALVLKQPDAVVGSAIKVMRHLTVDAEAKSLPDKENANEVPVMSLPVSPSSSSSIAAVSSNSLASQSGFVLFSSSPDSSGDGQSAGNKQSPEALVSPSSIGH